MQKIRQRIIQEKRETQILLRSIPVMVVTLFVVSVISMNLLAWIAALDGSKGERPFANSSEFTNSLQSSISGSNEYDAVVLPAPLHPDII